MLTSHRFNKLLGQKFFIVVLTSLLVPACNNLAAVSSNLENSPPTGSSAIDQSATAANGCTDDPLVCLEIRNDLNVARIDEVAYSSVPVSQSANLLITNNLVVEKLGGISVPAQFRVISRWGGTVDNVALPIRWLGVALQDRVDALGTEAYSLHVRSESTPAPIDPLTIEQLPNNQLQVDTNAGVFVINPDNPALIEAISIGGENIYAHTPGAGPRLALPGGVVMDTSTAGAVQIDTNSFVILEQGPLRASFALQGHFIDAGGATLCDDYEPNIAAYESMGFTAVLTLTRGTTHIDLQFNFRNECLDARFEPFLGPAEEIDRVSWEFPVLATGTVYFAGLADIATADGNVAVEQRKGAGSPWQRRARTLVNDVEIDVGTTLSNPIVGIDTPQIVATAQLSWMRFREPQALAAENSVLSIRFIGEELVVGGGKGIWNQARISLSANVNAAADIEPIRSTNAAYLERGLLIRARLDDINGSGVFPDMGSDAGSSLKTAYQQIMTRWHNDTIGPNGQHELAKTYGSQLWPDIQGASWSIIGFNNRVGPAANSGGLNYWNASDAELLEFLRTGEPRWAWDLSLPLTWQQIVSAYVNRGENGDGVKNGYALTSPICSIGSGICDEGQWYRYGGGSDDYTYTSGHLGYLVRPNYMLLRRFAQAGQTTQARYSVPRALQSTREQFLNQVDLTRQAVQHYVLLANCAEFVPGAEGQACHDHLMAIITELSEENLSTGLMCQSDIQPENPSSCAPNGANNNLDWCDCVMPQQFVLNALVYPFLNRIFLNYGDIGGALENALVQTPWNLYRATMGIDEDDAPASPSDAERPAIPLSPFVDWYGQPGWDTEAVPYRVQDVDVVDNDPNTQTVGNDEANRVLDANKAHTVALLLMAHAIDPTLNLCNVSRTALNSSQLTGHWDVYEDLGGWWKGSAQVMQSMVFGVGISDSCSSDTSGGDDGDGGGDGGSDGGGGAGSSGGGALGLLPVLILLLLWWQSQLSKIRQSSRY